MRVKLIDADLKLGYAWVWRFLATWRDGALMIGYYPDYETPTRYWLIRY